MRAGVAVDQHDARRGDVEAEAQQRRAQQHGRKGRELERPPHVDHGQQDHERQRDVEGEEDVQQERRQRQHHHGEDHHDQHRHAQAVAGEFAEGGYRGARVHTSAYSSPTLRVRARHPRGDGRIQGAHPEDVREHLRHRHVQARREFPCSGRSIGTARAPASATRIPARDALRRCGGCSARPDRRPSPARAARAFSSGRTSSATAKCVGLTITTSAVGTLCIMRRRASVCCIWRMRCFVSGRPSDSLASSRSSWRVMRSARLN